MLTEGPYDAREPMSEEQRKALKVRAAEFVDGAENMHLSQIAQELQKHIESSAFSPDPEVVEKSIKVEKFRQEFMQSIVESDWES